MRKDIYVSKILLAIYLEQIRHTLMDIQNASGEHWSLERTSLMQMQSRMEREAREMLGDGMFTIMKNRFENQITNTIRLIRNRIRSEWKMDAPIHEGQDLPGEVRDQ